MFGKGEDRRVLKVCPVKLQSIMTSWTTMPSLFMLTHRMSVLMFSFDFRQNFHPGLDPLPIKMEKKWWNKWLCATSTLLLHGCLWSRVACGRKEMHGSSYCDNHSCHQSLWWPRTAKSYQSPGSTPSKEKSRWKMRSTEVGIWFCLHLQKLIVQGGFLAKGQMCIADFLISPVENMPLPPRIKSLDALDGSASHRVSLPTEIVHSSLSSSTDTNLAKPCISFFPFCLQVKYWEWK